MKEKKVRRRNEGENTFLSVKCLALTGKRHDFTINSAPERMRPRMVCYVNAHEDRNEEANEPRSVMEVMRDVKRGGSVNEREKRERERGRAERGILQ